MTNYKSIVIFTWVGVLFVLNLGVLIVIAKVKVEILIKGYSHSRNLDCHYAIYYLKGAANTGPVGNFL